jgi:hypothetical protein
VKVDFKTAFRTACRTGSLNWGAVPIALALSWWINGVPEEKLRLSEDGEPRFSFKKNEAHDPEQGEEH